MPPASRTAESRRRTHLILRAALAMPLAFAAPSAAQAPRQTSAVPSPESHFGFAVGADYRLADYDQVSSYVRALDAASDRVVVQEIGTSTLGRPLLMALVSTPENLRNRERYREISRRLARARDLEPEEARALAREGKAIIWIDGGLHSTEVAHGQMTPELAYWLATDEGDEARRIRENAIVLVMVNMNPDGLDIVASWYRDNVGTPFETAPLPELYHHYIGHDNNRDWYMFTQAESQAVARQLYHGWFPQIVYNHHQSSPFPGRIWGPPFENPVNPNLDPLVVSGINRLGETMRARFDFEGKPGYNSGIVFDMWWNGSMRGAPDFHNMLGFLTETALYRYATPHCYAPDEIPYDFGERGDYLPARRPSTSYTNPWLGGCWHLRDAVDYMLTASRAVADHGARHRDELLYNIYHMGRRQIARGERSEGGPFAYVVDVAAQHDPGAAVELLRTLRMGAVEIRRADAPFVAGGTRYPAGTYVVPPQAFRPYVVDLIEPKAYPDRHVYPGGPPNPPYDMTGYELPLQMGVRVVGVEEPFTLPVLEVEEIAAPAGAVVGTGSVYLSSRRPNASALATNRLLDAGVRLAWARAAFTAAGRSWPAGTLVVLDAERPALVELAREHGLTFQAVDGTPNVALRELGQPRIALYRSRVPQSSEGWTRWLLERFGFRYETLTDAGLRAGSLAGYDVIIIPDQAEERIVHGFEPGTMPPEHTGGMGTEGVAALNAFVENGGSLIAFDEAIDFAISGIGLPVQNTVRDLEPEEFFIPGSLVRVRVDSSHALAAGMPEEAIAMFARSQVMEVDAGGGERDPRMGEPEVYARYARSDFLASGWALGGERHLAGRAAAVRVPVGEGHVLLLGFTPHFRGQPHNTYKLLFNALHGAGVGVGR